MLANNKIIMALIWSTIVSKNIFRMPKVLAMLFTINDFRHVSI